MPSFSIIIPYYRSAKTAQYTLESAHRAKQGVDCEILLVDDGSEVPAEQALAGFEFAPDRIIRQENRGLLFARLKGLEEAFQQTCPQTRETETARQLFGEKVFKSWRALPFDFCTKYQQRKLRLWRSSPNVRLGKCGQQRFVCLARIIGPLAAGWILRRVQNRHYKTISTLPKGITVESLFKTK